MSQTTAAAEEILGQLPAKTRDHLLRIARKIAEGFEGEIYLSVHRGGGVRQLKWILVEDGSVVREDLG